MVELTTSSQCTHEEDFEKVIHFDKRTFGNKVARIVYKVFRVFYIMIYFYFFEFITIALIFIFPVTLN